jgi:hypothetical protein
MNRVNRPNISDHAREISFAVFRVCTLIERSVLRTALESAAVNLAAKSVSNRNEALASVNELEQLVRLAEVIGEIKTLNSKVLIRELSDLGSAISQSISKTDEVDLEAMFDRGDKEDRDATMPDLSVDPAKQSEARSETRPESIQAIKFSKPPALETNQAVNRQSAISQFIKRLPNGCRMKDLVEKFPSVSERTLRNDLQTLVSSGHIERFGAIQGPFSYYRFKNKMLTETLINDFKPFDERTKSFPEGVTKGEIIAL